MTVLLVNNTKPEEALKTEAGAEDRNHLCVTCSSFDPTSNPDYRPLKDFNPLRTELELSVKIAALIFLRTKDLLQD